MIQLKNWLENFIQCSQFGTLLWVYSSPVSLKIKMIFPKKGEFLNCHMIFCVAFILQYIRSQKNSRDWCSVVFIMFSEGYKILVVVINSGSHIKFVWVVWDWFGFSLNGIICCIFNIFLRARLWICSLWFFTCYITFLTYLSWQCEVVKVDFKVPLMLPGRSLFF